MHEYKEYDVQTLFANQCQIIMGNETVQSKRKTIRNSYSVDFGHELPGKIKPSNGFKLQPINEPIQRSQLQITVNQNVNQTEPDDSVLKKQNNQTRKQSFSRLKKLNNANDQLRRQLIRISTQLTQKLKKKKYQVKKIQQKDPNPLKKQSLKKQLQNAYKQIDMYKKALAQLKLGQQSQVKLLQAQDKISAVDADIQKTLHQIQAIKNVNNNQVMGIIKNKDKSSQTLQQLKSQLQALKLKLKQKAKQQRVRQKKYMEQHHYMKALQQKLKKNNKKQQQDQLINSTQSNKISEIQIKVIQQQIQQLKMKHDQYHKKINLYISSIKTIKQEKSQVKGKLQEKNKIMQGLKYKRDALVKLLKDNLHLLANDKVVSNQEEQLSQFDSLQEEQPDTVQQQQQQRGTFDIQHLKDHQLKHIPKQQLLKLKQKQSINMVEQAYRGEPKQWKKQLSRIISKGKQMVNEKPFSSGLQQGAKISIKIVQMSVWMNKKKQITAIQPTYMVDGRIFQGSKSSKNVQDEYRVTYDLQENDYIKSILGIFGKTGFLDYLVLQSYYGKITKIGRQQTDGDNFAIGVAKQQTPIQITGANRQDGPYWRISRLDFEVLIQTN